jgi:hypothetical protein
VPRRPPPQLIRPFTPTETRIGTGLVARLDYADIGKEIGDIKPRTVRGHVEAMAQKIIGLEDLEPRHAVVTYFLWLEWAETVRRSA